MFGRYLTKEASTICDAFRYGSSLSEGGPCLGWRNTPLVPFLWLTYNETMLRAKNFGSGLLTLGLSPGENTRLGILARCDAIIIYKVNCRQTIIEDTMRI